MGFRFNILIFLCVFMPSFGFGAGPLEALSEQAYKLNGGQCESSGSIDFSCQSPEPSLKKTEQNLSDVSAAINDPQVDHYFELLATKQVEEFQCAVDFAKAEVSRMKKDFSGSDLKQKLSIARMARQKAQELCKKIVSDPKLATPACPGNFESLEAQYPKSFKRGDAYSACKELISYRQSYQAVLSAIPLSHSPALSKVIENYATSKTEISDAQLQKDVLRSLEETGTTFSKSRQDLAQSIKENGGAGLDRSARYELLQDPALNEAILNKHSQLSGVACMANARYGAGADQLNNAVMIGSFALSGGVAVLGKAGAFTARAFKASEMARKTGLVSLNAMNILKNTAGALDMASMMAVTDQACFSDQLSSLKTTGACVSAPTAEKVERDNCILAASLTAMGVVPQSAVGFLVKRKQELAEELRLIRMKVTHPKTSLEKQLVDGKIISSKKSKLGAFGAKFVKYEDGLEGVWKKSFQNQRAFNDTGSAEVAAYQIDHYLGLNKVPVTVRKEMNGVGGTVQYRVKELLKKTEYDGDPEELGYFDYLIANADRHGANYLQKSDGKLVAIDHGLAFADGTREEVLENFKYYVDELAKSSAKAKKLEAQIASSSGDVQALRQELKEVRSEASEMQIRINSFAPSEAVVEKVRRVDDWKNVVGDTLNEVQLKELKQRQKALLEAFDYAEKKIGKDRLYPAGPSSPLLERD
jgi:hypothetical protein